MNVSTVLLVGVLHLCFSECSRKSLGKNPAAVKYSKGKLSDRAVVIDCTWCGWFIFRAADRLKILIAINHTIKIFNCDQSRLIAQEQEAQVCGTE